MEETEKMEVELNETKKVSKKSKAQDLPELTDAEQAKLEIKKTESLLKKSREAAELVEDKPLLPDSEGKVKINLFSDLDATLSDAVTERAVVKETTPRKKAKIVDLASLNVVNKTELDKERDLRNALYGNKAAFQIVAAQSGYMAKVIPLVHKDIVNLLYENVGRYEYKKSVFHVIWEKVFDTSVGKLSFDDFLRYTSIEDMETFYYGLYASTFPNEGSFRFRCRNCGAERDYTINHANLIKTTDKDKMKKLIEEVSRNATSIDKMKEYSLVGKNTAIQLSESKIIIELKTPTLFDSLEILRTVPEKTIDRDTVSITNMLYINKVLIPAKDGSGYIEEIEKPKILRIIDNLAIDDANELEDAVFDRVDDNRITYSIKNFKCSECGHEVSEIPLSIEDILFTLIFEKAQ